MKPIYISHRALINGQDKNRENNPKYISELLNKGISVEIDVWYKDGWFLGHDQPKYKISVDFLYNEFELEETQLYCHAKNLEALNRMANNAFIHCFWHQNDDFTLTSNSKIWTYPGKKVTKNSIIVDLDKNWRKKNYKCYAVCSDYI